MKQKKTISICLTSILLVVVLAASLIGCAKGETWTGDPTVQTNYGAIKGVEAGAANWVWEGIPYAKPPVDALRWKAPQDPEPWNGTRNSTDSFDVATQPAMSETWNPLGSITGSEDCLYLNIWRPQTDETNLPVYFWIHGGSNVFGGAKDYNGACRSGHRDELTLKVELETEEGIDKEKLTQQLIKAVSEAVRIKLDRVEFVAKEVIPELHKLIVDERVY